MFEYFPGGAMTTYSTAAPIRLTTRGRRALFGLGLSVVLVAVTPLVSVFAGASNQVIESTQIAHSITVQSGDTLWEIARSIAPNRDPREVVWEIKQMNNLGVGLVPGDKLLVPLNN
ncbi:MAG: LysM peptidoglycan-binding domain-containing protein [Actinobacteria bacterium]|nr:LysM peptidoglycan-binding domain-containing protein [Actinomycetota bacterium]